MDPLLEESIKSRAFVSRTGMSDASGLVVPILGISNSEQDKGFALAVKQLDENFVVDGKTMSVKGVVSDQSVPDRSKEIVVQAGIDWGDFKANPLGLFQHNRYMPVCKYLKPDSNESTIRTIGHQIHGEAFYIQKGAPGPMLELAAQVFQLCECKMLNGLSLGFVANWKDYKRVPDNPEDPYGPGTTSIVKCKAIEISNVFFPDNQKALITQVVRKGLGEGSGVRPLLPPLYQAFAPYAEPEAAWSHGWTPPPPVTQKEAPPVSNPANPPPAAPPATEVREVIKEVVPAPVQEAADRCKWFEKHVTADVGLPIADYAGKPSQKTLAALHDAEMFLAVNALATADLIEGDGAKTLQDVVQAHAEMAAQIADRYKALYGDELPGSISATDLLEAVRTTSGEATTKALATRCVQWTIHYKGWRKAHTNRVEKAVKTLESIAALTAAPTPEQKVEFAAVAKSLAAVVAENGGLKHAEDELMEKAVNEVRELAKSQGEQIVKLKKELARARNGV